ncbi:hypothetical protein B4090_4281 [Bacillus licheniformis]|nr:hypothetical protein B4090_4281 [Bacillus licheniformis]
MNIVPVRAAIIIRKSQKKPAGVICRQAFSFLQLFRSL